VLTGGRLTLGFGVGYLRGEFDALGASYDERGAQTDEHLAALKLLWESGGPAMLLETARGVRSMEDVLPDAFGPDDLTSR